MAAAAATNKQPVKNPKNSAEKRQIVASTGRKQAAAKKSGTPAKKNPANKTAATPVRRNGAGSGTMAMAVAAIGGAFAITGFDEVINFFAPSLGDEIRIGLKFISGFGAVTVGRKYLGTWANTIGGAFLLAGALDAAKSYVVPMIRNLIYPAKPAPRQLTAPSGDNIGYAMPNDDGSETLYLNDYSYDQPQENIEAEPNYEDARFNPMVQDAVYA